MLAVAWYHNIFAILFAFLCIFLMMVILLQRGRGVGLAGAFGGAGGHSAFGAKTGDVLTWATVIITAIFLFFAVMLNYAFVTPKSTLGKPAEAALQAEDGAATPAAPTPTPTPPPATRPTVTPGQPPPNLPSTAPVSTAPAPTPAAGTAPATAPATPETPKETPGGG
jgi:preprotein translocase subunit SecG